MVAAIPEKLATLGYGGGADPGSLCNSGFSGLCLACRVAAASGSLLLPTWRGRLRSFRNFPTSGHWSHFRNFDSDRLSPRHLVGGGCTAPHQPGGGRSVACGCALDRGDVVLSARRLRRESCGRDSPGASTLRLASCALERSGQPACGSNGMFSVVICGEHLGGPNVFPQAWISHQR